MNAETISHGPGATSQRTVVRHAVNPLEEDLFTLNSMAPDLLARVPALFEQSVRESLGFMLGMKETDGVLGWFRKEDLASRPEVFQRLAARYGARASPLQKLIDEAFRTRVHELLQAAVLTAMPKTV